MSYVYFALTGRNGDDFCKIGFTGSDPEGRIKSLQTGCPYSIELLGFVDGPQGLERALHNVFDPVRVNGEWFIVGGKLKMLVDALLNELGFDRFHLEESRFFELVDGVIWAESIPPEAEICLKGGGCIPEAFNGWSALA